MAAATFFEHQRLARRNTRVMVVMFLLAVVAIVAAVDAVAVVAYLSIAGDASGANAASLLRGIPKWFLPAVSLATAGTIFVVSLINVTKLASGGTAVAEMIGARRLSLETRDPLERRYINVVEEMAIASGVRVPAIYIMDDERGINAFAAGWDVSGSVVAVTRGTLETLTRDELQGVVAHEFSHILNGDMRLNIRMMGVLAGIVFIGAIGEFLMRSQGESRHSDRDSSGDIRIFLVGLAIFIVGYVGLFFARLIKAAVSRQREFLADASSVQFTRNPDGIAGALDQIRGSTTLIDNRYAEDMSHMFFGQSIRVWADGLHATHPPLDERIRRVHPRFERVNYRKGRPAVAPPSQSDAQFGSAAVSGFAGGGASAPAGAPTQAGRRNLDIGSEWGRSAGESAKAVGTLTPEKIDYASRLLAALPAGLRESLREADGARAAIIALLLAPKDDVLQQQLEAMKAAGCGALAERARAIEPLTRKLGPAFHLAVIDLSLPAIKGAPEEAKKELLTGLEAVINADRRVSLHEFVVLTLVRHQLAPKGKPAAQGAKLSELRGEASTVLSLVAHAGRRPDAKGQRQDELQAALRAGAKEMGLGDGAPAAELTLAAANTALQALKTLAPMQQALLIKGLFAAATSDGSIRVAEAELLRLVGAVLDCPLPPLLDEIDPASLAA